jgi:two-component system OmpR family sensor kinase
LKRAWFLALLPLALGLVSAGIIVAVPLTNPVFFVRVDLAVLALLIGGLLTGLGLAGLLLWSRTSHRYQHHLHQLQANAAADHRRFLQRLDHELKNPLTAIRAGLANLVNADASGSEAQASIEAQTLRLSRLTADLRKLAELETVPLERTGVDLAELLPEALELAQEQPGVTDRRITLTLPQAPWPLPTVSGDWDLLFLTVYNLLNNALKFTCAGDTIELRAFEDGTNVVIEVADTGPGIPEDELPYVWEELYRGKEARGVEGSGLGLPLARAIVERHGGQVSLRSRSGQGTVVAFRLPAV